MVLALVVIIVFMVGKMLGIGALIKAPRVLRGESSSDRLIVRRKINEAPPRLRHKICLGDLLDLPALADGELRRMSALVLGIQRPEPVDVEVADHVTHPARGAYAAGSPGQTTFEAIRQQDQP